jgi:hypothetical protein
MSNELLIAETAPDLIIERSVVGPQHDPGAIASTDLPPFALVRHFVIGTRPPRRPNRTAPIRKLSNEHLRRIAAKNPPPQKWFDEEEGCPF